VQPEVSYDDAKLAGQMTLPAQRTGLTNSIFGFSLNQLLCCSGRRALGRGADDSAFFFGAPKNRPALTRKYSDDCSEANQAPRE